MLYPLLTNSYERLKTHVAFEALIVRRLQSAIFHPQQDHREVEKERVGKSNNIVLDGGSVWGFEFELVTT